MPAPAHKHTFARVLLAGRTLLDDLLAPVSIATMPGDGQAAVLVWEWGAHIIALVPSGRLWHDSDGTSGAGMPLSQCKQG